jgi:ring-1,2-phenylacetyl-CoA epoxidase subunit PaaB
MSYEVPLAPGEQLPDLPDGTGPSTWPLWEVFVRARRGLSHVHAGSLHAPDAETALTNARDVYTRRSEGVSVWVARSDQVTASDPDDAAEMFETFGEQPYRLATFYQIPDEVGHM